MAITKIEDVIVPELFNPYLIQKTVEANALLSSGIATADPSVNITKGGKTVNIPFWKTLEGDSEIISETVGTTINKVSADSDVAALHARAIGYSVHDLATLFSGDDPMGAVGQMLGKKWSTEMQKVVLSTLTGIFGVAGLADSVMDQSTKVLDATMMSDAGFLLGDKFSEITAVAFHSAVLAKLSKLDLVDWVVPSQVSPGYYTYMGKRVIVDDAIIPTEGAYPIYFFGSGAIAYNENPSLVSLESDRDIIEHSTVLVSNRVFTMHPRGVKWIGVPAGATPTDAEIATAANWQLVDNRKNVAVSKLIAKL